VANDNVNSYFAVEYMGRKISLMKGNKTTVLEGHDIKVTCVPFNVRPYKFDKWDDGYESPYRVLHIDCDNLTIDLKAYCSFNDNNDTEYIDSIDASSLNKFEVIYPKIMDVIFVDEYYIDNIYINNCEIDILQDEPYIKIINGGFIQILNIDTVGNLKLSAKGIGGDCILFLDDYEVPSSTVDKNECVFEFNGGILTLTGNESCVFDININKEVVYDKGRCMLCLDSEDTLKLYTGDLFVEGGIAVNGNLYGISPVKFAQVTNITPLIFKNNNITL
jgi:hypothetical protein